MDRSVKSFGVSTLRWTIEIHAVRARMNQRRPDFLAQT